MGDVLVPAAVDPWVEMEEAMGLCKENRAPTERYEVTRLPDGDLHVCKGCRCPFVELNADKVYVCQLSGICYGALSIREDHSTGRAVGSSNPDDHAGEPVGGAWKQKKDMKAMSTAAYNTADGLNEDGVDWFPLADTGNKDGPSAPLKRGARCVDEPVLQARGSKRPRMPRRSGCERECFDALQADAEVALCKLINYDKRPHAKPRQTCDPRLTNRDLLFQAAVKRYANGCLAAGTPPTLDAIHNLAIACANIVAKEKQRAAAAAPRPPAILQVRMREQITALVASLWLASCSTPYMEGMRRGSDSYKPFVCGVLYALKRGVHLPDGTVVVPAAPQLAEALPALRSTAANSVAKALHASSHRGLCSLHRSISSCSAQQAAQLYENSARLARQMTTAPGGER